MKATPKRRGEEDPEESIRKQIQAQALIREKIPPNMDLPLSNECKRVVDYAAEEASRPQGFVCPEHQLLGILRETGCFAEQMLTERGANLVQIRKKLSDTQPPA